MNSAFTNHQAGTKAGRVVRAVRRAAVACALVLVAGGAMAQQNGDRRDDQNMQQAPRQDRYHPQQDREGRQADIRAMEESRRRSQDAQDQQQQGRGGRMTPDERRDLRRQINEAGMDLYQRRR
jgi:hypothetical protein